MARILTPEIFGEVGFAIATLELLSLPGNWGTEALVVQERLGPGDIDTLFTLRVGWALVLGGLVVGVLTLAPSDMYETKVRLAVLVLAVGQMARILSDVPASILQKRMRVTACAGIELAGLFTAAVLGIVGAVAGFGVAALIAFYLVQDLLAGTMYLSVSPYSPAVRLNIPSVGRLWSAGKEILAVEAAGKLDSRLDDWTVGAIVGRRELGLYNMAWKISLLPQQMVLPALNRVVLPLTAEMKRQDRDRAGLRAFVGRNTMRASVLTAAVLFASAEHLVVVVLGHQWIEVASIVRGFALYSVVLPLFSIQKQLLFGESTPAVYRRAKIWEVGLFMVGVLPAAMAGGTLIVVLWLTLCHVVGLAIVWKGTQGGLLPLEDLLVNVAAGVAAAGVGWYAYQHWFVDPSSMSQGGLLVTVVVVTWGIATIATDWKKLTGDLRRIRQGLQ